MKTIGFIGAYDKIDLVLYVAKVLTALKKKVLVIDSTTTQKARYVVPSINPVKSYVTEYEGIDVAIGFENYEEINRYLGGHDENETKYDVVLIDVDNIHSFEIFNINQCEKKYFVTSFDLYSIKKGLEILRKMKEPIKLTKILFAKDILKEDNEYLNYLALGTKVMWNEEYRVYFPLDNGDQSVIIENQRVSKLAIRKLSSQYRESLYYVVQDIIDDVPSQQIKRVFKILEREV